MNGRRILIISSLAAGVLASTTGCSMLVPDSVGSWRLAYGFEPTAQTTEVPILVTRQECASGRTGPVGEVSVDAEDDAVTLTALLPAISGNQACPGNDETPFIVTLDEPLGERPLLDGSCVDGDPSGGEVCARDGVRWAP